MVCVCVFFKHKRALITVEFFFYIFKSCRNYWLNTMEKVDPDAFHLTWENQKPPLYTITLSFRSASFSSTEKTSYNAELFVFSMSHLLNRASGKGATSHFRSLCRSVSNSFWKLLVFKTSEECHPYFDYVVNSWQVVLMEDKHITLFFEWVLSAQKVVLSSLPLTLPLELCGNSRCYYQNTSWKLSVNLLIKLQ